ncbi:MAG: DoxX family protein [Acidimicrobiia bacterium]
MDFGLLLLRVLVGLLLAGHGAQKLFGWFGGSGLAPVRGFLASLGYPAAGRMAIVAGASEVGGGLLLASGLLMPVAGAVLVGTMLNAGAVHLGKGLWSAKGGYEYPLVLAGVAAALAFTGAGRWSLDAALGLDLGGVGWGVASLAVGVASGLGTLRTRRLSTPVNATA